MPSSQPLNILYLSPTCLADRRKKTIRGVQVFDMFFMRDLCAQGHQVTLPAERTWQPRLREYLGPEIDSGKLKVFYTPRLVKPIWNGLWAGLFMRGRFDLGFVGNSTKGIVPVVNLMRRRGLFDKVVIQASKQPPPNFAKACDRWPCTVTTLSGFVTRGFLPHQQQRAIVYYGVVGSEMYFPGPRQTDPSSVSDDLVHLVLVGLLDNAWKGAPVALEAMKLLPADIGPRVRLHMMSYQKPPACDDPRIIFHPWRPAKEIPARLREMDVMLVPSSSGETFSQAMVQGMLTELPVITSELDILTEKLDQGGGLVAADAAQLASHIATLTRDAGLRRRMGAVARRIALERYRWDTRVFVDRFLRPPAMHDPRRSAAAAPAHDGVTP